MSDQATKPIHKSRFRFLFTCLALGVGLCVPLVKPKPVAAAERILLSYGLLEVSLPIESLSVFVKEGKVDSEFAFFAHHLKPQQLTLLRDGLQKQLKINPGMLDRLLSIQMAEAGIKRLGQIIQTDSRINGFYAIRAAVLLAASDREGLTVLNVMRHYPTKSVRIDVATVLELAKQVTVLPHYRDAIVAAISQESATESAADPAINYAQLPDLGKPGPYRVNKQTLTFKVDALRPTLEGLSTTYDLVTDVYLPEGLTQPAPMVVVTHGFGSTRASYGYIAQHLASHGFVTVAPEHLGSDLAYRNAYLAGEGLNVDISPLEFISRNLDISYTIDKLQQLATTDPAWTNRINFQQIGVMGNSFGGTTALAVAGATINQARLSQECTPDQHILNFSVLLQCRARYLPPQPYRVADPRIKATFAAYPLTSVLFGPEGLSTINIPTFIMAGSRDVFTPVIVEQMHPFIWLKTPEKYLGMMINGTHFSTAEDAVSVKLPGLLKSPRPDIGRRYFQSMSVAFFHVYLENRAEFRPYLTASYADALTVAYGQSPTTADTLPLKLVRSLTPAQIITAYGKEPPLPIVPKPVLAIAPQPKESILQEIQRTGTLKVAFRGDTPPFSYFDAQANRWTGYCDALADALASQLTQQLNVPGGVEVVRFNASLDDRFKLVQDKTVHLGCGPDTIRQDVKGVAFSYPFFATGTQLLVKKGNEAPINPNGFLEGIRIGTFKNSLTEQFIQNHYPKAKSVNFLGAIGREQGLQSLNQGEIDALASDGVLLLGALRQQKLSVENYTLIPQKPLSCDFYGLALPSADKRWQETVNAFMEAKVAKQVQQTWLAEAIPTALSDAGYCLSQ
ncbi:MAG: alpha/beta hydrolase [Scytolyngbya sp. HA4215-MV1]|jgi:predicted dienelactone hydrolase/ABC-type amino acid transport substrate-binding protein|nr:alpha/beta hydrolase [Scytolyngbya sp. HA4215-MV1]